MKIQVTQDDIDRGTPRDNKTCALAVSIQRQTNLKYVSIAVGSVYSGPYENRIITHLSDDVCDWYMTFDKGLPVKPFEFELEV